MPSHPDQARVRLGELLVRRRIELDPRYRNRRTFTDERAPGLYRIINDIELGRRDNYEPGTVAALEAAYDIAPGAISRALEGGELEPPDSQALPPQPSAVAEDPSATPETSPADADVKAQVYTLFQQVNLDTEARLRAEIRAAKASYRRKPLKDIPEPGTEPGTEPGYIDLPGEAIPTFDRLEQLLWNLAAFDEDARFRLILDKRRREDAERPTRARRAG